MKIRKGRNQIHIKRRHKDNFKQVEDYYGYESKGDKNKTLLIKDPIKKIWYMKKPINDSK